jgi:DNA-binding NarL/FixJ family response regulator
MNKIRAILVDDQRIFTASLSTLFASLAEDIEVIGIAHDGQQAVHLIEAAKPDVVLMDVRMPYLDGVEATRRILTKDKEVKIIMLTTFDDDRYVHDSLNHGAVGYLLKDMPPLELITAIRAACEGSIMISPSIARKLVRGKDTPTHDGAHEKVNICESWRTLTAREKEVFKLIIEGFNNSEMAETLFISERTVKNYISTIYGKLGVKNRLQLIKLSKSSSFDDLLGS